MNFNRLIAGVAIAGLTVVTTAATVPSFAAQGVSRQSQTQLYAQRDWDRYGDRDRDYQRRDRDSRRYCYYERNGRRIRYCCRERYWNGRSYQIRTYCQPVRR